MEMATPAAVAASAQAAARAVILEAVTLEDVSNDLTWRRETADKLPEVPFAPRF
jgi:hypothetical protein